MLQTPFGNIVLRFDGETVPCSITAIENKRLFPDVAGAFLLKYGYVCDGKAHALRIVLDACGIIGHPESGERLEAISFFGEGRKMTIGCEGWFCCPEEFCGDGYDYNGFYLENGLEIVILPNTKSRNFCFGVAWLDRYNGENGAQTWLAADPFVSLG